VSDPGVRLNVAEDADDPAVLKVLGLVLDSTAARAGAGTDGKCLPRHLTHL
jgi:hypothetical protein